MTLTNKTNKELLAMLIEENTENIYESKALKELYNLIGQIWYYNAEEVEYEPPYQR